MGQVSSVIHPQTFMVVNDKLSAGCDVLIKDHNARLVFAQFIKKGAWIDDIAKMFEADKVIQAQTNSADPDVKQSGYNGYNFPPGTLQMVENVLQTNGDGDVDKVKEAKEAAASKIVQTCFDSIQMKSILLATLFPIFIKSQEYTIWVDQQLPQNLVLPDSVKPKFQQPENSEEVKQKREERLDELFQPQQKRIQDLIEDAASSITDAELETMLYSGSWLSNLLATVEDLPLCVSLADASKEKQGFPLVYVNKCFEKTTLFDRKEIVGQNCRFLQSDKTEQDQIQQLRSALASAKPCKVALTNKRKDGSDFFNLLAMKPIFNSDGAYSYVIGVQFDISQPEATDKQIRMVDDLLSILPNVFQ